MTLLGVGVGVSGIFSYVNDPGEVLSLGRKLRFIEAACPVFSSSGAG